MGGYAEIYCTLRFKVLMIKHGKLIMIFGKISATQPRKRSLRLIAVFERIM
jgi:hypothetical protein